jgi:hypothetical protein
VREAEKQSLISKVAGVVVALVAAWAAQQIINSVWTRTVGHKPPKPEDPGDARFAEVAAAATLTAAIVALARVLATRGTAKYLR